MTEGGFRSTIKWGSAGLIVSTLIGGYLAYRSQMSAKDAAIEVIEDIIENKTGIELDLNGKEPQNPGKIYVDFSREGMYY